MGLPASGEWYESAVRNGLIPAVGKSDGGKKVAVPTASEPDDIETILWVVRQAGYPDPEREFRFHPERKWRFDYAWPDYRVALEREGGKPTLVTLPNGKQLLTVLSRHRSVAGFEADREKYNAAQIAGWAVLGVTPPMARDGRAMVVLLEALAARSKHGPLPR